ncbi:MAG: ORF6N domain-containing protein [Elusimicrobiota bacterium]
MTELVLQRQIEAKIFVIRGKKVMLDRDLALLYGVVTRQLTRQVRRNIERFPEDFMVQLTRKEFNDLKCQFGTSRWGGTRKLPVAFTEHGIVMLSSVLNSKRAIQVNIQIVRTFIKLRKMMFDNKEIWQKIDDMEQKYDKQFKIVFDTLKQLVISDEENSGNKIGFSAAND